MKKFNLIEVLKAHGFEHTDSVYGCHVFTLELTRQTEVAWYGVQEFRLKVSVLFNPDMTSCQVSYYDGGKKPFKVKTHLADKRCWNAIQATVEGKGFEMGTVPGEGACSGNCQSCPYLDFDSGFPGETLTCCKCPGHERILDVDFDVSAVI